MSRRPLLLAMLLLLVSLQAACGSDSTKSAAGHLSVENVRVDRPPVPDQAAMYFVIDNGTGSADTLRSVRSNVATEVTMHESRVQGGTSKMVERPSVPVPARSRVTFEPGGLHVMLEGLHRPLEVGDSFDVTFTFARAGEVTARATVVSPGANTDHAQEDHHG